MTLTSTTPAGLSLGLGIGLPTGSSGGCSLAQARTVSASTTPQLEVNVDDGDYCVQVFDVTGLAQAALFSLTVIHP